MVSLIWVTGLTALRHRSLSHVDEIVDSVPPRHCVVNDPPVSHHQLLTVLVEVEQVEVEQELEVGVSLQLGVLRS